MPLPSCGTSLITLGLYACKAIRIKINANINTARNMAKGQATNINTKEKYIVTTNDVKPLTPKGREGAVLEVD
jgi:hypothetical protein